VNAVVCLAFLAACSIHQNPPPAVPTVTPTLIAAPVPVSSTPAPAALASRSAVDPVKQAVLADWEEMFRTTQSYEYVQANGRPDDKAWWIEQARRFYIGRARAVQQQQIESMFWQGARMAPGFIQDARYIVEVQNCPSATECALQVRMQSGKYWAYDISQKSWSEAGPVEPVTRTVSMRYDSTAGRWMVN
jgi:hypothetical protein